MEPPQAAPALGCQRARAASSVMDTVHKWTEGSKGPERGKNQGKHWQPSPVVRGQGQ